MPFKICTDSTSNLPVDIIERFGLEVLSLDYTDQQGNVFKSYVKGETPNLKDFYDKMREKQQFSTACINEYTFIEFFEPMLVDGYDVLYIGFSSGLSATYNSSVNAAKALRKKFPDRKIYTIDSLSASIGLGLEVYRACVMQEQGMTIEEIKDATERDRHKTCALFTVDDLYYLYKGGRLSPTSYFAANLINIKPLLRCDEEGRLSAYGKVIGRKKSLAQLVAKTIETIVNPEEQVIFVGHGDCLEDAEMVAARLRDKLPVKDVIIGYIDSVIGAHSGPGTLAIFYLANDRSVK